MRRRTAVLIEVAAGKASGKGSISRKDSQFLLLLGASPPETRSVRATTITQSVGSDSSTAATWLQRRRLSTATIRAVRKAAQRGALEGVAADGGPRESVAEDCRLGVAQLDLIGKQKTGQGCTRLLAHRDLQSEPQAHERSRWRSLRSQILRGVRSPRGHA